MKKGNFYVYFVFIYISGLISGVKYVMAIEGVDTVTPLQAEKKVLTDEVKNSGNSAIVGNGKNDIEKGADAGKQASIFSKENPEKIANSDVRFMYSDGDKYTVDSGLAFSEESLKAFDSYVSGEISSSDVDKDTSEVMKDLNGDGSDITAAENLAFTITEQNLSGIDPNKLKYLSSQAKEGKLTDDNLKKIFSEQKALIKDGYNPDSMQIGVDTKEEREIMDLLLHDPYLKNAGKDFIKSKVKTIYDGLKLGQRQEAFDKAHPEITKKESGSANDLDKPKPDPGNATETPAKKDQPAGSAGNTGSNDNTGKTGDTGTTTPPVKKYQPVGTTGGTDATDKPGSTGNAGSKGKPGSTGNAGKTGSDATGKAGSTKESGSTGSKDATDNTSGKTQKPSEKQSDTKFDMETLLQIVMLLLQLIMQMFSSSEQDLNPLAAKGSNNDIQDLIKQFGLNA